MKKRPKRILISSLLMTFLCIVALALIATLPGGGWWFGAQVQNVSSKNAGVSFAVYDYASGSTSFFRFDTISPGAYKLYQPTNFPGMPDNFQGSSIASSNQDIRAIVNLTNRYAGGLGDPNSPSPAAGQYQGANAAGSPLYFPLVKNDYYSKTTTIIVQNAGTANATASATFYFPNWTYTYTTPTLRPGQMAAIEPINAHSGQTHPPTNNSNAFGSLTVTSSQPLAGAALEHNTMEDHATVLQATRGFISGDANTILYAPINKHNWYGRFTGLLVQNLSGGYIDITVTYTANDCNAGTIQKTITHIAQNHSAYFDALNDLPDNCFAPAKIEATGNIVAVVNEAFTSHYLYDHPGRSQEATAYDAISNGVVTKNLSVPLFKEDSYSKSTALVVQNVSGSPAHVVATFKNNSYTFKTNPMDIDPKSAIVLLDMRLIANNPPSWWHGWDPNYPDMNPTILGCGSNGCGANGLFSVSVTSDQDIVGIANESTYPIETPRIN